MLLLFNVRGGAKVDHEGYMTLYTKQPKEILEYVEKDMMSLVGSTDIDDNMLDKITEWRYIILKAIDKI
jgi:hypothetical protein